ncbi:MAG: pilus assembly protein TadG-related protein [Sphingopyxis sp.]
MMNKLFPSLSSSAAAKLIARLKADQGGNIFMILGFAIIPLTFMVGFGVDYARAMALQTQLNAAADSAALAAVAPGMILQSSTEAESAARKMFNSQTARLSGFQNLNLTVTISASTSGGSSGALGYLRKATVTYTVESVNQFSKVLGAQVLTIGGTASASAQQPPNVDFYLAMDNSPSMLLPATSDGVSKIIAATKSSSKPDGCAFACHAMIPKSDGIYIRDTNSREVLLSTGYYAAGSKQNVWYRWDPTGKKLYDSSANAMDSKTSTVSGPTLSSTTAGPTTTTSGSGNNKTTTTTTTKTDVETTVTTAVAVTYSITDSTSGPVTITKKTVSTPTTDKSTTVTTTKVVKVGNGNPTTTTTTSGPTKTSSTGTATTSSETYDTGYWADGYWLTHNYGLLYGSPSSIVLRKDDVVSAASQLIPFASQQAAQYHVTYQAQMFSFDWTRPSGTSPVRQLNNLTNVNSYGSGFSAASIFPQDDYWWKNSMPTSATNIDDKATDIGGMLTTMLNTIPAAGSGAPGATPQKILFIITDGMLDQPNGSGRYFGPMRTGSNQENAKCTAIKAKGIKIAILYTQYLPESLVGDSWSQTNVAPFLPALPYRTTDQVLEGLQRCASLGTNGAPLVQTVTANDNITTALQQLFSTALQTARLVQ